MGKILRVNMTTMQVSWEDIPECYKMLGGRALTSRIISDEVVATSDPLGENNKLVFAPGLLGGMAASSVHRLSVGGKSPLTTGIKESNAGGTVALKLAKLDIKAVIIEGRAPRGKLYVLKINKTGCSVLPADELRGLKATPCANKIKESHGDGVGIALIGPVGEQRLLASGIVVTDQDGEPARYSGRGGLGAVMGSKGIKALIVDDNGTGIVKAKDAKAFVNAVKRYSQVLLSTPQTSEIYTKYGTAAMVDITNGIGGLPTRNFQCGKWENADKINGTALRERILERGGETSHACVQGCLIKSSNIYICKDGKPLRSFEYETIVLCGPNCGIGDLDEIAEINLLINEAGLDSMDMGVSIGIAMEAGIIPFGDVAGVKYLLEEVVSGTPLGRIIGNGAAVAGKVLGVERIPAVKGQAMAGYEPRAVKGHGITYATSPMGADHTAGMTIREGLDPTEKMGQVEASQRMQLLSALYDSAGLCLFTHVAVRNNLDIIRDLVNARYGAQLEVDDLLKMARDTLRCEVEFNRRAGLGQASDRLSEAFTGCVQPSSNTVFDFKDDEIQAITQW